MTLNLFERAENVGLHNYQEVMNASKDHPVLVDFYTDYCRPCKRLAPVLDALASEGHHVVKIDVEAEQDLAKHYQITAVPTVMVLRNGDAKQQVVGIPTKQQLLDLLTTWR